MYFSWLFGLAKYSPTTALVISVAFLMTMNYVNNVKMFEKMESELKEQVLSTELAGMEPAMAPEVAQGEVVLPPIVVEPKVVTTADGTQMVVTPQVIVASKQVSTPSGETVIVTPEVTQLAPAPAPASAPVVQEQVMQQPPQMAPAPVVEQERAPEAPKQQPYSEACFAMQSYDMSKVSGVEPGMGYAAI